MADTHKALASSLRDSVKAATVGLFQRQEDNIKNLLQPLKEQLANRKALEAAVSAIHVKYEAASALLDKYSWELQFEEDNPDLQRKLADIRQLVQRHEKDYRELHAKLSRAFDSWQTDWRRFCDSSQAAEEPRVELLKTTGWEYANTVSTACVVDDEVYHLYLLW
jgi:chromosome segregation ATPase